MATNPDSNASNAEKLAERYSEGDSEYDKQFQCGGSGKQRNKLAQSEHKHPDPQNQTRKIVQNIQNNEENQREEKLKQEKKESTKTK